MTMTTTKTVDRSGASTVSMVVMLVSAVGGVFILFALMALCYRSVVVHRNLSLCLRLVESFHPVPLYTPLLLHYIPFIPPKLN